MLSAGGITSVRKLVADVAVDAIELRDVRLTDAQVLLLLQGMSSFAALGVAVHQGKQYLPIIAEGFCAYRAPVVFDRVVFGVPREEPIPMEQLVASFRTT